MRQASRGYSAPMGAIPTTAEGLAVLVRGSDHAKGDTAGSFLNACAAGRRLAGMADCLPVYQPDTAAGGGASPAAATSSAPAPTECAPAEP
jgi:hypothetical protein